MTSNWWRDSWSDFKADLPHQSDPYSRRNWGSGLHSLCSYQGKMKPALAHHLVATFVPPGGRMLDVFAGVGTIPFEAALAGKQAYGFDISPAAIPIARAKIGRPDPGECASILGDLESYILLHRPSESAMAEARSFGFNRTLEEYFHPATLEEVVLARDYFHENPPVTDSTAMVMACALHVLHGNRPYALSRRSHPITPFAPTGDFEYKSVVSAIGDKLERSLRVEHPDSFVPGQVFDQDATTVWPDEVSDLDAIITSPPFFDSTRFHIGNWMRLWFSGWSAGDFKSEPKTFIDERQKSSFDCYRPVFEMARERLRPGGLFVLHLGRSKKCDMGVTIAALGQRYFEVADVFSESVVHCESHGIRDKGTVVEHQYVVLLKRDGGG